VRAIKHLHKKLTRQVKELDMWDQASKNLEKVQQPSTKKLSASVKK